MELLNSEHLKVTRRSSHRHVPRIRTYNTILILKRSMSLAHNRLSSAGSRAFTQIRSIDRSRPVSEAITPGMFRSRIGVQEYLYSLLVSSLASSMNLRAHTHKLWKSFVSADDHGKRSHSQFAISHWSKQVHFRIS